MSKKSLLENYTGSDFYCDVAFPHKDLLRVEHDSEHVLSFHHTRPHWPVHIVVTPKKHIASFTNYDPQDQHLVDEVLSVVREIAARIEQEYGAVSIRTNLGRYQDSKHLHFHILSGPTIVRDQKQMKTILIDAVNTLVSRDGDVDTELFALLQKFPHAKILMTNANPEQVKQFQLEQIPYQMFSCAHDPDKPGPVYWQKFFASTGLLPENVVYIEHNQDAVKTAVAAGITAMWFDPELRDVAQVKRWLMEHL